jgi:hypothetical protein
MALLSNSLHLLGLNAMAWLVECLIKTIKQGLTIMATFNIHLWDVMFPRIFIWLLMWDPN